MGPTAESRDCGCITYDLPRGCSARLLDRRVLLLDLVMRVTPRYPNFDPSSEFEKSGQHIRDASKSKTQKRELDDDA